MTYVTEQPAIQIIGNTLGCPYGQTTEAATVPDRIGPGAHFRQNKRRGWTDMAFNYRAQTWEAVALREIFGESVAEVVFYDAGPEEIGCHWSFIVGRDAKGNDLKWFRPPIPKAILDIQGILRISRGK